MKRQVRFYFIFCIAFLYALCYSLSAPGAGAGFNPNDLIIKEVKGPSQIPAVTAFYRSLEHPLDEGVVWDRLDKAQKTDLMYHLLTASLKDRPDEVVATAEVLVYPRLFDGPRAQLQLTVNQKDSPAEAITEALFHLAAGISAHWGAAHQAAYAHAFPKGAVPDLNSLMQMAITIGDAQDDAIARAVRRILKVGSEASIAKDPYGYVVPLEGMRTIGAKVAEKASAAVAGKSAKGGEAVSEKPALRFVKVETVAEIQKGYFLFRLLQNDDYVTPEVYASFFVPDDQKMVVYHAYLGEELVAILGGGFMAGLEKTYFDPDTIVVAEGHRRGGLGTSLLMETAKICETRACDGFGESGRKREEAHKLYEATSIKHSATNYKTPIAKLIGLADDPTRAWVAETISRIGL